MDSEQTTFDDTAPRGYRVPWRNVVQWLVIILIPLILIALILPAIQQAREAARRSTSKNNLKQLGLALHNYHETYAMFPPSAIVGEDGTLYHGWMYTLIPYLECSPLFERIDPSLPWNHERNVEHYKFEHPVFLNPSISETSCEDGFGYAHYAGSSRVFKPNGSLSIGDISDGTADTFLVGDINEGFKAWGTPANVRDPALGFNDGPHSFGSPHTGGGHFLMADGSVWFIPEDIDTSLREAMSTPAAGDSVEGYFD